MRYRGTPNSSLYSVVGDSCVEWYFVLGTLEADAEAIGRLEGRVANLIERLGALGLRPIRLRDRALEEAAHRFGWPVEVSAR